MAPDPGKTELSTDSTAAGENDARPRGSDLDAVADGHEHALDAQSVTVARLVAAIWGASIAMTLLAGVLVVSLMALLSGGLTLVLLAGWVVFAVLAGLLCYRWPQVRYDHIRYRVDGNGFRVRRGVLWRSVTSVPKSRVQHTDVSQGPLQRSYGLASLVIHTAGTQDSLVTLRGLPHEAAMRIRDYLLEGDDRIAV